MKCWNCGREGHLKNNCRTRQINEWNNAMQKRIGKLTNANAGKSPRKNPLKCWNCGREGHIQSNCQARQGDEWKENPEKRTGALIKTNTNKSPKRYSLKCWNCGREGHLRSNCQARQGYEWKDNSREKQTGALIKTSSSKPPKENPLKCWNCGQEGHIRGNCQVRQNYESEPKQEKGSSHCSKEAFSRKECPESDRYCPKSEKKFEPLNPVVRQVSTSTPWNPDAPSSPEEDVQDLQAVLEDMYSIARDLISVVTEKLESRNDTTATDHRFRDDDKVALWNPTRRKEHSPEMSNYYKPNIITF